MTHASTATCQGEFHYEGAEKTLEVHFSSQSGGGGFSLRKLPQSVWDDILDHAKCKILSKMSNPTLDCYVLSESSLFVYEDRMFLKTCGMTTLLACLKPLISSVKLELDADLEWIRFSRKNFIFPQDQQFPHHTFDQETQFCLETLFPYTASSAHVLGDLLSDHWNVLYLDQKPPRSVLLPQRENIVNFMMYGIDPYVAKNFYFKHEGETQLEAKHRIFRACRFDLLFDVEDKSLQLDSFQFQPCGFSLNAIVHDSYYVTIHVTPETKFSYASFETNMPQTGGYAALLETVLTVFSPKTCTVGLFSDSKHQSCFDCREDYGYRRISHESARIQNLFYAEMSSFVKV